jgi:hypothetical protein
MEILRSQVRSLTADHRGRMQRGISVWVILILSASLWLAIIQLARLMIG